MTDNKTILEQICKPWQTELTTLNTQLKLMMYKFDFGMETYNRPLTKYNKSPIDYVLYWSFGSFPEESFITEVTGILTSFQQIWVKPVTIKVVPKSTHLIVRCKL